YVEWPGLIRPGHSFRHGSGIAGHVHGRGIGRRGAAGGVDDVLDHADSAQGHGEQVVEVDAGAGRGLEGVVRHDRRVDVEVAVAAQAVGRMAGDVRGYLVGGVAVGGAVHPGGLVRRVVGHLVLEEDGLAAVAVPLHVVVLVVLDEQAGRQHAGAVHDQPVGGGVDGPADGAGVAVVGAPGPDVVGQGVIRVDDEAVGG